MSISYINNSGTQPKHFCCNNNNTTTAIQKGAKNQTPRIELELISSNLPTLSVIIGYKQSAIRTVEHKMYQLTNKLNLITNVRQSREERETRASEKIFLDERENDNELHVWKSFSFLTQ